MREEDLLRTFDAALERSAAAIERSTAAIERGKPAGARRLIAGSISSRAVAGR